MYLVNETDPPPKMPGTVVSPSHGLPLLLLVFDMIERCVNEKRKLSPTHPPARHRLRKLQNGARREFPDVEGSFMAQAAEVCKQILQLAGYSSVDTLSDDAFHRIFEHYGLDEQTVTKLHRAYIDMGHERIVQSSPDGSHEQLVELLAGLAAGDKWATETFFGAKGRGDRWAQTLAECDAARSLPLG
jgi:hypothetical protein